MTTMDKPETVLDFTEMRFAVYGVDPDDQRVLRHDFDVRTQDEQDGAALRRLREALPKAPNTMLDVFWHPDVRTPPCIVHVAGVDRAGHDIWRAYGEGDTIAEAADKCREALSTPRSTPQKLNSDSSTSHIGSTSEREK